MPNTGSGGPAAAHAAGHSPQNGTPGPNLLGYQHPYIGLLRSLGGKHAPSIHDPNPPVAKPSCAVQAVRGALAERSVSTPSWNTWNATRGP